MPLGELETVTIEMPPPMPAVEITGTLIAHVNSREWSPRGEEMDSGPRPKWSNNRVWKTPSGLYVICRESKSLIYHRTSTACRTISNMPRGELVTVEKMTAMVEQLGYHLSDAVSCGWNGCKPTWPEDLKSDQIVRYEVPRTTIRRCPDGPEQVIGQLMVRHTANGATTIDMPAPSQALIEQCVEYDPEWLATARAVAERIS
jgi:hypothetical protein